MSYFLATGDSDKDISYFRSNDQIESADADWRREDKEAPRRKTDRRPTTRHAPLKTPRTMT